MMLAHIHYFIFSFSLILTLLVFIASIFLFQKELQNKENSKTEMMWAMIPFAILFLLLIPVVL